MVVVNLGRKSRSKVKLSIAFILGSQPVLSLLKPLKSAMVVEARLRVLLVEIFY